MEHIAPQRTERILDLLASRFGMVALIMLLAAIGIGGGARVQVIVSEITDSKALFDVPKMREGTVALSDIFRLNSVLQQAKAQGSMTPELSLQFARAADFLYLREQSFGRFDALDPGSVFGSSAHARIKEALGMAESAIANGFADLDGFNMDFAEVTEAARASLVTYLDDFRRTQRDSIEQQTALMFQLTALLTFLLVSMMGIGIATALLLRREVLARKLRQTAERRAEYLAFYDSLTSLPNRIRFQDYLEEQLSARTPFAMVLLDLNDFNGLNEQYGHGVGDLVLHEIGARLSHHVETESGFVARTGGDEFAVLLPYTDRSKVRLLCDALRGAVAEPIVTKSASLVCDFSLGVVTTAPARTQSRWSSESIVRAAEMALYEAKSDEKGNLTFYDAELEQRHVARRALIDAIPLALENDEFFVAFQPKVDLLSRETYGFEALIRWARDGSIVPPDEFIPFAEENNLIIDLDLFVMRTAVSQLVAWNDLRDKPLCVSVNLSGLHFSNDSIVQEVKNVLAETGLAPHLLTLEITETILLDDWSNMQILLKALRELGVLISLDDFGTGYSSLAYLRRISADELKIDRSFVTELEQSQEARFILDAVVDIANGLGMTIVVEGIETEAQSQIVQSFGCTNGQGYLFGAPKDADRTVTDILNVPVSLPSQKSA